MNYGAKMNQAQNLEMKSDLRKRIKVLIVDDSALARKKLSEILNDDPDIEVIYSAGDPYIAVQKMKKQAPDVITLDLEMPRMNGLQFLKILMEQHPLPVVVISSHTKEGSAKTLQAYELGAVEVIGKPEKLTGVDLHEFQVRVCDAVKAASQTTLAKLKKLKTRDEVQVDRSIDRDFSDIPEYILRKKIIVLGASTGGTVAIEKFLSALPDRMPGIAIVQHMPENFTYSFAQRLNRNCRLNVKEAENGDIIKPGWAYIAPGHSHLLVRSEGSHYFLEVKKGPLVNRHRPSVDVLFRSAARYAGKNAVGIIMTGMGNDGAAGMLELKQSGAMTIAQDEESCVVFGMPKEAIKLNCVDKVVPLEKIPAELIKFLIQ